MADQGDLADGDETADEADDPAGAWSRVDRILAGGVVIWALGLGALLVVRDESPPEPSDAPIEAVTAEIPQMDDPPTSAEVVEALEISTGFTPGEVVACGHPAGDETGFHPGAENCPEEDREVIGDAVSYGIVVENTGDDVVRGIRLDYRFLDADDEPVPQPETAFSPSDRINHDARIAQLAPGETIGLGDSRYLEHNDVAAMEVGIVEDGIEAMPGEYYENFEQPRMEQVSGANLVDDLSVSSVEVSYSDPGGAPVVRFTIESHQAQSTQVGWASVIFRDADGAILGGASGDPAPDAVGGPVTVPPDGTADGEISVDDPMQIPGVDPDRTEVHLAPHYL